MDRLCIVFTCLYFFNAVDLIAKRLAAYVYQQQARRYRRSRQQPEASLYSYLCPCPAHSISQSAHNEEQYEIRTFFCLTTLTGTG